LSEETENTKAMPAIIVSMAIRKLKINRQAVPPAISAAGIVPM
jgi:hypothetical protein